MKIIKYIDIDNCLKNNSINVFSDINHNEQFNAIKSLKNSKKNDLSFFSNIKYINDLKNINAKACLIKKEYTSYLPKDCAPIIVNDPYQALACLLYLFSNQNNKSNGIISKDITFNGKYNLHSNIQINPYCVFDENIEIFDNVIIGSNSYIGPNVSIHKDSIIHENVSLSNCVIMSSCEIQSGARIGGSGFGFDEKSKNKIIHTGNVVIGKNSTIGSNTTIDRAVFESTIIGEFSQIDNLVQIAHNVIIGKHAIIAAQVGIAGSTSIGDYVKIGGQAGIAGHLNIGDNVTIAGKSGVTKNINSNKVIAGFPAKDINLWKRDLIKQSRIK